MIAQFVAYGTAQPQGNKTAYVRGGRAVLVEGRRPEAREQFKSWREAVASAARVWQSSHVAALFSEPVAIDITFYLPRPASAPKRIALPAKKPDLDKLGRSILDALTGIIIVDDALVVDLGLRKRFAIDGPPCAVIRIAAAAR